jgi:hypothetical protein
VSLLRLGRSARSKVAIVVGRGICASSKRRIKLKQVGSDIYGRVKLNDEFTKYSCVSLALVILCL